MRRRYLISYDVADDRRRNAVFRACREHGDWVQFSVFVAELNGTELVRFRAELTQLTSADADQVLIVDLGSAEHDTGKVVAVVGRPYAPPARVFVV